MSKFKNYENLPRQDFKSHFIVALLSFFISLVRKSKNSSNNVSLSKLIKVDFFSNLISAIIYISKLRRKSLLLIYFHLKFCNLKILDFQSGSLDKKHGVQ